MSLYLKISGSPVLYAVSQRCCSFLCYVVTCCALCASPAGCVVTGRNICRGELHYYKNIVHMLV
jgi:hypothetical protein